MIHIFKHLLNTQPKDKKKSRAKKNNGKKRNPFKKWTAHKNEGKCEQIFMFQEVRNLFAFGIRFKCIVFVCVCVICECVCPFDVHL